MTIRNSLMKLGCVDEMFVNLLIRHIVLALEINPQLVNIPKLTLARAVIHEADDLHPRCFTKPSQLILQRFRTDFCPQMQQMADAKLIPISKAIDRIGSILSIGRITAVLIRDDRTDAERIKNGRDACAGKLTIMSKTASTDSARTPGRGFM